MILDQTFSKLPTCIAAITYLNAHSKNLFTHGEQNTFYVISTGLIGKGIPIGKGGQHLSLSHRCRRGRWPAHLRHAL
jgi:hypothetical protein